MSTAHVARRNYDRSNIKSQHHRPQNGFKLSNNSYTDYTFKQYLPTTSDRNGFYKTTATTAAYKQDDVDSDTLDDMESQSPTHPSMNYPHPNQSVRHRLTKANTSNIKNKNRYYRRNFKKFATKKKYKHKYKKAKKPDYTLKIIAAILLFVITVSVYYFYGDLLTFTALKENHHSIIQFIDKYPKYSPFVFILFECVVVGLTIPGATVLSMAAGLFFRQPFASLYAWFGCGLGAFVCYLSVRFICADCFKSLLTKHGDWFKTFSNGLKKNELLYLIYVRYVIIIPFWFVNVAAALFGCKIHNFVLSTFIATIPGALLLTTAGRGLANAFESYTDSQSITTFGLFKQILWSKDMLFCILLLLFCLSIPLLLKKYGGKQFDIFNDSSKDLKKHKLNKFRNNDFIDSDSEDKNK